MDVNYDIAPPTTAGYKRRMAKMPPLSIRFDPEVKSLLDELAAEQERSIGWIVNKALRAHFGIDKPKAKSK
jgi:hypothetical protein